MPEQKWIFIRQEEVRGIFDNRKEAVRYFKKMLRRTLSDFEKQDKIDEYDYSIKIPEMEFKPIHKRDAQLSLL